MKSLAPKILVAIAIILTVVLTGSYQLWFWKTVW